MKVVVFVHNHSESRAAYSGGRYHALLQAGAIGRAGAHVTVVVDSMPAVTRDLAAVVGDSVEYVISPDFAVNGLTTDVVLVSPTGAFHPAFYEAATRTARANEALLVLINFESANWYNAVAPLPDDARIWDYWRRVVAEGGVVLSSTKQSDLYARSFYYANRGRLEFIQSYPPVNTEEIRRSHPLPRGPRQQLVYFARPFTHHKGADDVLAMPDAVFADADLHVISGGATTEPFYAEVAARVAAVPTASVTVHTEVSETFKFALMRAADVLLFPSRFEGYGYPPLEAAYCGTETVAYRLPVLVETVGAVARLVPVGDREAFAAAVVAARESPRSRQWLHDAISPFADYGSAGSQLVSDFAALLRGGALTEYSASTDERYSVHWAPFTETSTATSTAMPQPAKLREDPPVPPVGSITRDVTSDSLRLEVVLWARATPAAASLSAAGVRITDGGIAARASQGSWRSYRASFTVPGSLLDATLALGMTDAAGAAIGEAEELRIVLSAGLPRAWPPTVSTTAGNPAGSRTAPIADSPGGR